MVLLLCSQNILNVFVVTEIEEILGLFCRNVNVDVADFFISFYFNLLTSILIWFFMKPLALMFNRLTFAFQNQKLSDEVE